MPRRPVVCTTPLTAGDLRDDSYLKTMSDEFGNRPRSDYMFPLEEDEDDDTRNDNALPGATLERIQDHLKPAKDTTALQISMAFESAWKSCGGCLHRLVEELSREGWKAEHARNHGHASPLGFSLPHAFVTVSFEHKAEQRVVIDPYFRDNWAVPHSTKRYQLLFDGIPEVIVAPLLDVLEAVTLLSQELERCFQVQKLSLPPWRTLESTVARWARAVRTTTDCKRMTKTADKHPWKLEVSCHPVHTSFHVSKYSRSADGCDCCGPQRMALRELTRHDVAADASHGSSAPVA